MSIRGQISPAPAGIIGFDTAERLDAARAKQFYNQCYCFCVRYVSHDETVASQYEDLTQEEGQIIIDAGMALMVVQHPLRAGWTPSVDLGRKFVKTPGPTRTRPACHRASTFGLISRVSKRARRMRM
jgi:hypothetical protein